MVDVSGAVLMNQPKEKDKDNFEIFFNKFFKSEPEVIESLDLMEAPNPLYNHPIPYEAGGSSRRGSISTNGIHAFTWSSSEEHCSFLEEKIDIDLGFYYTKKYIAAAFWSQISMPINLALTFITALTTAQANTTGMMSEQMYSMISIAALILSVLNTFFRPHVQMSKNAELMRDCSKIASEFEAIYYGNDSLTDSIEKYKGIQKKISDLRDKEGADTINVLTDFIHYMSRNCCFRSKQKWLDMNRTIMEASRARSKEGKCSNGDCCVPICSAPTVAELNGRHPVVSSKPKGN